MPQNPTSFINLLSNQFSRNFGGTLKGTADPYVTGYCFSYFKTLPPSLGIALRNNTVDSPLSPVFSNPGTSLVIARKILSAASLGLSQIPNVSVNKADIPALGGFRWGVPTSVTVDNTISMRFLEYSGLPVTHILHNWVRMIRDYRTGVSGAYPYQKGMYSGTLLYWTTKPDGMSIEFAACFTGVFPLISPVVSHASSIDANDTLQIDVQFHIDYMYTESWVRRECNALAKTFAGVAFGLKGDPKAPESIGTEAEVGGIT